MADQIPEKETKKETWPHFYSSTDRDQFDSGRLLMSRPLLGMLVAHSLRCSLLLLFGALHRHARCATKAKINRLFLFLFRK